MKPLATLVGTLFLIATAHTPAYHQYEHYETYQPAPPGYYSEEPSGPSFYEQHQKRMRQEAEARANSMQTPAWQANRNNYMNACRGISGNSGAFNSCVQSAP